MSVLKYYVWKLVEEDLISRNGTDVENIETDEVRFEQTQNHDEGILSSCLSPNALFVTSGGHEASDPILLHDYCLPNEGSRLFTKGLVSRGKTF